LKRKKKKSEEEEEHSASLDLLDYKMPLKIKKEKKID